MEQTAQLQGHALDISLTVNDVEASAHWYQHALGFAVATRHEREGNLMAIAMAAGNVRILLNRDNGARGENRVKGEGFSFQITTAQNIDEIAKRIVDHGSALASEPADMPWGVRAFRVVDPDGFRFSISSIRP